MKQFFKLIYKLTPFKRFFFLIIRALFQLPESVFKHLYFKGVISISLPAGKFKVHHHGYQIENELFWAGIENAWEKVSFDLWMKLSQEASVVMDIGANTGVYSLISRALNSSAKVYGFEPVTRVKEKYQGNVNLNGWQDSIMVSEVALSSADGKAMIYDSMEEHVYSVTVSKDLSLDGVETTEVEIRTQRLDTFIETNGVDRIDLMKIDVETHEPEVLEGMGKYLERFRPSILIEILSDEVGQKVQAMLEGKGYLYYHIDEVNEPELCSNITKSDFFNYLVCQREVAENLGLKVS